MKNNLQKLSVLATLLLNLCAATELIAAQPNNKQLTLGMTHEFYSLNPLLSQQLGSQYIYSTVGYRINAIDADWQWRCWLCTKMPTLENGMVRIIEEKGKKKLLVDWEFKANAKWGDGTPVTGYDIQLAWKVGKSPNVASGGKEQYTQIEAFTIDPKNPKKFTTKYDKPRYDYYQMPNFYVLPHHIEGPVWERTKNSVGAYEKQTTYNTNPTNSGLYCGPYLVKEIKPGSHVVVKRNPHFHGKKPKIERLVFKIIPNSQALEANLLSGTVDMIVEGSLNLDQALSLDKRLSGDAALKRRFEVKYREGPLYEHIDLNLRNPILQDIRVRRALVYAIDRHALVKALFAGRQQVALHPVHPLDPYYTDDVMRYPYDAKRAASLLDAAGWTMGPAGIRQKNGKKLSFIFMTTAENKTRELVQVFLQNEWKKVGIEIKLKNTPPRIFFSETLRRLKFPAMAMYAWAAAPDFVPWYMLHSSEIPTAKNGYSGQNFPGFKDPETDAALEKITEEFSFAERRKLMKIVQQQYAKEVPVIPLYYRTQIAVIPMNLRGFRLTGHQFYAVNTVEQWHLQ